MDAEHPGQFEILEACALAMHQQEEKDLYEKGELTREQLTVFKPGQKIKNWIRVESGNGIGKTKSASGILNWFLDCFAPSAIFTFAPGGDQARFAMWAEIRKDRENKGLPGRVLETEIKISGYHFAAHRTVSDGLGKGEERIKGKHEAYQLFILDEADGIPDFVFDSITSMTSGGNSLVIMFANPKSRASMFHKVKNRTYVQTFRVSTLYHPNVREGWQVVPGAVKRDFVETKIENDCDILHEHLCEETGDEHAHGADCFECDEDHTELHSGDDFTFELPYPITIGDKVFLPGTIFRPNKGVSVATAANTPVPTAKTGDGLVAESKKLDSRTMDAEFEDPLRKNFERLAKASPSQFGHLGAGGTLDDPYAYIRAKNADGSFRVKNADLDLIIKGILAINSENPTQHGATPLVEWAQKSSNPEGTIEGAFEQAYSQKSFGDNTGVVRKAVDSTVGAALIRTDIEPILREAFNRVFPAYEMFPKIPANGINHTWTQQTAYGSASLLDELGDYSAAASNNTYSRVATTNIAVAASQREIGLKAQFASQQSGMSFNLGGNNNLEVMGALIAIANVIQGQIFQGNYSVAAKTLDDEDGLTNTKGFDGFRQQLKGAGYSFNKGSDSYLTVLRRAVGQLFDAGANMNEVAVFLSIGAQNALDAELETFYQYLKAEAGQPTPTNFSVAGLSMLNGILARLKAVPAQATQGNGIGHYTFAAADTEDIYVLDPNGTALPYIGSPSPTILELPTGWGNHLSNTFVPFLMIGMAIYVKPFNRKIRIAKTTI